MKVAFAFLFVATATATPIERSVSPSRQFVVYGSNAQLRGVVSGLAEQMKQSTMSICKRRKPTPPICLTNRFASAKRAPV